MPITIDRAECSWCLSPDATKYEDEYGVDTFCESCYHAVHVAFPEGIHAELIDNAYPQGWTCNDCADEWHGEMPTIKNAATICESCVKEK
jgi:hypothetical protein